MTQRMKRMIRLAIPTGRMYSTVLDLTERGLGVRSRRYSMIVDDGVVSQINLEEGGGYEVSDAGTILNQL